MLTNEASAVLPGMEDINIGLREVECECGCGTRFLQAKVGRVRKYLDNSHKAYAYRTRKTKAAKRSQAKASRLFEWMEWADQVQNNGFGETIRPDVALVLHALTHLGPEGEKYAEIIDYMLQNPPER